MRLHGRTMRMQKESWPNFFDPPPAEIVAATVEAWHVFRDATFVLAPAIAAWKSYCDHIDAVALFDGDDPVELEFWGFLERAKDVRQPDAEGDPSS